MLLPAPRPLSRMSRAVSQAIPIFSVKKRPQTGPSKAHQAISVTFHHDFNPTNTLFVKTFTKYFLSLSDFMTVFLI